MSVLKINRLLRDVVLSTLQIDCFLCDFILFGFQLLGNHINIALFLLKVGCNHSKFLRFFCQVFSHFVHIAKELVYLIRVGLLVRNLREERSDQLGHLSRFFFLLSPDGCQFIDLQLELFVCFVLNFCDLLEPLNLLVIVLGHARNWRNVLSHEHV